MIKDHSYDYLLQNFSTVVCHGFHCTHCPHFPCSGHKHVETAQCECALEDQGHRPPLPPLDLTSHPLSIFFQFCPLCEKKWGWVWKALGVHRQPVEDGQHCCLQWTHNLTWPSQHHRRRSKRRRLQISLSLLHTKTRIKVN